VRKFAYIQAWAPAAAVCQPPRITFEQVFRDIALGRPEWLWTWHLYESGVLVRSLSVRFILLLPDTRPVAGRWRGSQDT
jgi:hypothetical protein